MTKFPKGSYIVREGERRKVLEELGELRFVSFAHLHTDWGTRVSDEYHIQELERDGWKVEEVKEEWRPKMGTAYYCVNIDGGILEQCWDDYHADENRLKVGNCYRTEEEAQAAAQRVKKAYRGE